MKSLKFYRKIFLFILISLSFSVTGNSQDIYPSHKLDVRSKIIKAYAPIYPEMALKTGVEGQVIVRVVVDTNGNVIKANIMKSIPVLDQAALDAAKKWKFSPGEKDGKKVKVEMLLPVRFSLKNAR